MGSQIKGLNITVSEIYGAAAMLDIPQLTQIPRPDEVDMDAPTMRNWTEEEFDGTKRLLPEIKQMVELCAWPEVFCQITLFKPQKQLEFYVYVGLDSILSLLSNGDGFNAALYESSEFLDFILTEIPVGEISDEILTMSQEEASKRFSQSECLVRIAFADVASTNDDSEIEANNHILMFCDGILWRVADDGGSVTAWSLNKDSLSAELSAVFTLKGRDLQ